jgi:hypothetical protein
VRALYDSDTAGFSEGAEKVAREHPQGNACHDTWDAARKQFFREVQAADIH